MLERHRREELSLYLSALLDEMDIDEELAADAVQSSLDLEQSLLDARCSTTLTSMNRAALNSSFPSIDWAALLPEGTGRVQLDLCPGYLQALDSLNQTVE